MSSFSRLQKAFKKAPELPLNYDTKYVLFSDCHRGVGNSNDNFLKNQALYLAALQHYFKNDYTYIELGDGDELWENRNLKQIIEAHNNVFQVLSDFHAKHRLYFLYGNHDIVKKDACYASRCCETYPCCCGSNPHLECQPLLPDVQIHEGVILKNSTPGVPDIYLTHGHQVDLLNSTFWPFTRFLVRYVWQPLEHFGVPDPTSTAKNYTRKRKTEACLHAFARHENILLITGHTHRPLLSETDPSYSNCGSCVHPYSITCIEITHMRLNLIKWSLAADSHMRLFVQREVLAGPVEIDDTSSFSN